MDYIHYGRQHIDDDDIAAVVDSLKSGFLTGGPKVAEFENELARTVGAKYAAAVSNGTAALHISVLAANIRPCDEVVISPLTFAASANCVLYAGGVPVFADICKSTLLMDIDQVKRVITPSTKAIIPVHFGGELCNMNEVEDIAQEHGLTIIQDAAHSLGGTVSGKNQGEYPGMQIWSFHPVKTITTGEGGAITTNCPHLDKKLRRLRTHGVTRDPAQFTDGGQGGWHYEMLDLGFNYRLTDFQCALGISQLKKLERFASRRAEIVARYDMAFKNLPLAVQQSPTWSQPVRHLYTIRLNDKSARRQVYDALAAANVGVNLHYMPVYLHPFYRRLGYAPGLCPIAEDAYNRLITLPLHPLLSDEQVEHVIDSVTSALEGARH